jgi:hypothetical protein
LLCGLEHLLIEPRERGTACRLGVRARIAERVFRERGLPGDQYPLLVI